MRQKYFIGSKYGSLTLIDRFVHHKNRNYYFTVKCDCGNTAQIASSRLSREEFHCGCQNKNINWHGISANPKYKSIVQRCKIILANVPELVCDLWQNPLVFVTSVPSIPKGSRWHLHRIDKSKKYEPDNVVWKKSLVHYKPRKPNCNEHVIINNGKKYSAAGIAKEYFTTRELVRQRINNNTIYQWMKTNDRILCFLRGENGSLPVDIPNFIQWIRRADRITYTKLLEDDIPVGEYRELLIQSTQKWYKHGRKHKRTPTPNTKRPQVRLPQQTNPKGV